MHQHHFLLQPLLNSLEIHSWPANHMKYWNVLPSYHVLFQVSKDFSLSLDSGGLPYKVSSAFAYVLVNSTSSLFSVEGIFSLIIKGFQLFLTRSSQAPSVLSNGCHLTGRPGKPKSPVGTWRGSPAPRAPTRDAAHAMRGGAGRGISARRRGRREVSGEGPPQPAPPVASQLSLGKSRGAQERSHKWFLPAVE